MSRSTRRMIERLDPFGLPQQGSSPLALTTSAPKADNRGDAAASPRAPRPPRQRKPKASRGK